MTVSFDFLGLVFPRNAGLERPAPGFTKFPAPFLPLGILSGEPVFENLHRLRQESLPQLAASGLTQNPAGKCLENFEFETLSCLPFWPEPQRLSYLSRLSENPGLVGLGFERLDPPEFFLSYRVADAASDNRKPSASHGKALKFSLFRPYFLSWVTLRLSKDEGLDFLEIDYRFPLKIKKAENPGPS